MTSKHVGLMVGIGLLLGINLTAQAQPFTILHNFSGSPEGANPWRLTATNGLLYGSASYGGSNGNSGTIFTVNTNTLAVSTIFSFTNSSDNATNDASVPNNVLVTSSMIYGTAQFGGTNSGQGVVYAMKTNGTGYTPLYNFGSALDGAYPVGGLILSGPTLYGTTISGGTNGGGTIFKINTNGTGYAVLHSFTNTPDGFEPKGELVLGGSTLYGLSSAGGVSSKGAIFSINTNGSGYSVLYSFTNAPDVTTPSGGLVFNAGTLYGTALIGGTNNAGGIFAINTNGSGYRMLYCFSSLTGNTDGAYPEITLTLSGSYLYGSTTSGGTGGGGTVFLINTNGAGYSVLGSFTNATTGSFLSSGVIRVGNALWGTTHVGGPGGYGSLYRLPLPAITAQPQSLIVTNTSPATFTVSAADDSVISYQWYFNTNTLLAGQTGASFTLASATNNNAGTYTVVVSDSLGSVTSSPAVLTVVVPGAAPVITQQPQNFSVLVGNSASFTNAASGTPPLLFQWFFNTNTPLGGQTNLTLVLPAVTTNQAGYYSVVVTNLYGATTSAPALLTVLAGAPPVIVQSPQNYTVTNGYDATFTNVASGGSPLFYQWYFNTNTPVAVATNPILLLTFTSTNQAGYYRVIVTNTYGSATSASALLTVTSTKPIIFAQPQPQTVTNGAPFTFTVVAAGQNPLKYQWYTNSISAAFALAGKTNSTLSFPTASNRLAGNYLVLITNILGRATSSPALLTILTKPIMTLQPQNAVVTNGDPVSFTSAASGPGILSYQWYFRTNTAIFGATNTSLVFTNAITNLAGFYDVRVTNTFGAVTSSFALLTISNRLNFLSFNFDPASGSASFALANIPHSTNRLWASTNLITTNFWQVIATNVMATNGLWFFTDTNTAKTNDARFYRFSTP